MKKTVKLQDFETLASFKISKLWQTLRSENTGWISNMRNIVWLQLFETLSGFNVSKPWQALRAENTALALRSLAGFKIWEYLC